MTTAHESLLLAAIRDLTPELQHRFLTEFHEWADNHQEHFKRLIERNDAGQAPRHTPDIVRSVTTEAHNRADAHDMTAPAWEAVAASMRLDSDLQDLERNQEGTPPPGAPPTRPGAPDPDPGSRRSPSLSNGSNGWCHAEAQRLCADIPVVEAEARRR